jgi:ADP-ribosylglycohydrolase
MLGAIAGDIIGSPFEGNNIKDYRFPLFTSKSTFTDDTVMTVATADCILKKGNFEEFYKKYYLKYPGRGYGLRFSMWAGSTDSRPYNSWGNGSAMRVSPVGFACSRLEEVLKLAGRSAEVSHNHPEGIKGAQAVAAAVFMARRGNKKDKIADYIEKKFGYDLRETIESIKKWYKFDSSCQGSVPQAIRAFLESRDFEDAVRKAISIGGDSDTIACIAGGIAEAFYGGLPSEIKEGVLKILDKGLIEAISRFYKKFKLYK